MIYKGLADGSTKVDPCRPLVLRMTTRGVDCMAVILADEVVCSKMAKDKNIVAHALYLSFNEQNDLALAGREIQEVLRGATVAECFRDLADLSQFVPKTPRKLGLNSPFKRAKNERSKFWALFLTVS